nr:DNA polymerase [Tawny frogmouth aviadenovirus A]
MAEGPRARGLAPLGNGQPLARPTRLGPQQTRFIRTLPLERLDENRAYFRSIRGRVLQKGVFYLDGVPHRFQPVLFRRGLRRFLKLHRFLLHADRSRLYDRIDYAYYEQEPTRRLREFLPASLAVVVLRGLQAHLRVVYRAEQPKMPPMLIAKGEDGLWLWIAAYAPVKRCPACGNYWVREHNCCERRAAFRYHVIDRAGSERWKHVYFSCPAAHPHARLLFVTYDIETYTVFERKGKRMQPFMLCFSLSGHPQLVRRATRLARQDPELRPLRGGFYWIDPAPGQVARRFRAFRTRLQLYFSRDLVRRYARHNRERFAQLMRENGLRDLYDVPYQALLDAGPQNLALPEDFHVVDIVVLGHNICKFDELLLATELVEQRHIFPAATRCERSFMPRVGRLLFNDIRFYMPNPNYLAKDPDRLERWASGRYSARDARSVAVRFMVRDTLQLTSGAKLSKAAAAYALQLSKGHCPYEAVNEQVSRGAFEADADGFPVARYWEDPAIIDEQKALWRQEHPGEAYDIVRACLEYCMQDVEVTQELAHTLHRSYDAYFKQELGMDGAYHIFDRPTIPSNTHAFWKQIAFSAFVRERQAQRQRDAAAAAPPPAPDRENLPPGAPKKKARRPPLIRLPDPNYVAEVYAPNRPMFKYIRQALRGGRCYPTVLGPYAHPVYVFDICGMYASALTHPMPHGMPLEPSFVARHVDELNSLLAQDAPLSYFDERIKPSILKVEAYPPDIRDLDPLPPICSRRGGRLVWTNEPLYDEVITVIDIVILHNRGWRVRVLQDAMNVVFPEWKPICSEYVGKNIAAKEKADQEKNEVMRSISKMLSNALYGAFATNMDTTRIVFEQDVSDELRADIYEGLQVVKHVTLLGDSSFSGRLVHPDHRPPLHVDIARGFTPPWSVYRGRRPRAEAPASDLPRWASDPDASNGCASKLDNPLTRERTLADVDQEVDAVLRAAPFIEPPDEDHAHYATARETRLKPFTLGDASAEALTVLHLERADQMVDNSRYATQIACFVLGWSRAFFSEWSEILHAPDRGLHPHQRPPQSLYGDTDSLFVTQSGYERMRTRGAHRIKGPHTRLTFDPQKPDLYWACDCDIKCKQCGADTYSSEAVFLAPKLYGLKDAVCTNPQCGHVGQGKIRSKGHRQSELVYDILMRCWLKHEEEQCSGRSAIPDLYTKRTIFKTTLLNKVSRYDPFTIHNEQLVRILRPWRDPTLYRHGDFLHPYNSAHPNPRTAHDRRHIEDVGAEEPLAPLRRLPHDRPKPPASGGGRRFPADAAPCRERPLRL